MTATDGLPPSSRFRSREGAVHLADAEGLVRETPTGSGVAGSSRS